MTYVTDDGQLLENLKERRGKLLGSGARRSGYEVAGDPGHVLRVVNDHLGPDDFDARAKESLDIMKKLKSVRKDVQVSRISKVGVTQDIGGVHVTDVSDKTPGTQLFGGGEQQGLGHEVDLETVEKTLKQIADTDQDKFNKLVGDTDELQKHDLYVDTDAAGNIFLDPSTGFHFTADLSNKPLTDDNEKPLDSVKGLTNALTGYANYRYNNQLKKDSAINIVTIFHKLAKAGSVLPGKDELKRVTDWLAKFGLKL